MRQRTAVLIFSLSSDEAGGSSENCRDMTTAAVSKYSAAEERHVHTDNNAEERRDNTNTTTGLTLLTLIVFDESNMFLPFLRICFKLESFS